MISSNVPQVRLLLLWIREYLLLVRMKSGNKPMKFEVSIIPNKQLYAIIILEVIQSVIPPLQTARHFVSPSRSGQVHSIRTPQIAINCDNILLLIYPELPKVSIWAAQPRKLLQWHRRHSPKLIQCVRVQTSEWIKLLQWPDNSTLAGRLPLLAPFKMIARPLINQMIRFLKFLTHSVY